jgi:hypothetical protein
VRSDFKAVEGITSIETDLDEKTCSFKIVASVDVHELLDGLMKKNNKMSEWTFVN